MRRLAPLGALFLVLALAAVAAASSPSTIPSGFEPLAFSTLNPSDWWITGSYPCTNGPCEQIIRTENGGTSFTTVGAPPSGSFSTVVFADVNDGYAFGPGLWTTHDGGHSWEQLKLGTGIDSLKAGGGYVYALVSDGGPPKLMRSPVNRDRWTTLRAGGPLMWSLLAEGQTLLVQAGSRVLISYDSGDHLARAAQLGANTFCQFRPAGQPLILWAVCLVSQTGNEDELIHSSNGGVSWTGVVAPSKGYIDSLAPSSLTGAVVGGQTLERTVNAGASWSAVQGMPQAVGWAQLEFLTATTGLALGSFSATQAADRRLYVTTNGGVSYKLLSLSAPKKTARGVKPAPA